MSMSLRDFLNDKTATDAERTRRAESFKTQLGLAFESARPLVALTGQWTSDRFSVAGNDAFTYTFSKIPLAKGDVGYEQSTEVVQFHTSQAVVDRFFSTSALADIEIFSTLKPMPPSAFASLVFPITEAWSRSIAASPSGDISFWRNRRARPLLEHVPLPEPVRLTLARGWAVGRLIGRLKWDDKREACEIEVSDQWIKFLHPPLSGVPADENDEFGAVLAGALMAEMLAAAGKPQPLAALTELLRLGGSAEHPMEDPATSAKNTAEGLRQSATDIETEQLGYEPKIDYAPYSPSLATGSLQRRALLDIADALDRFTKKNERRPGIGR